MVDGWRCLFDRGHDTNPGTRHSVFTEAGRVDWWTGHPPTIAHTERLLECAMCGQTFDQSRDHYSRKYCSKACSRTASKIRHKVPR